MSLRNIDALSFPIVTLRLTKDALLLNPAFAAEQKALWFENRTGTHIYIYI